MSASVSAPSISPEALAMMGQGQVAYLTTVRSEDVSRLFPEAPELAPGGKIFVLHAADGRPMLLTDTLEAALANAHEHDLVTVRVH